MFRKYAAKDRKDAKSEVEQQLAQKHLAEAKESLAEAHVKEGDAKQARSAKVVDMKAKVKLRMSRVASAAHRTDVDCAGNSSEDDDSKLKARDPNLIIHRRVSMGIASHLPSRFDRALSTHPQAESE